MSRIMGKEAERKACNYLLQQGLKWITSNYHCRWGEIDLVMSEGNCLVFVEVRARSSSAFGGALASVTYRKQQKLLKTALHYLAVNNIHDKQPARFDVLSLEGAASQIEWIKNAFGLN